MKKTILFFSFILLFACREKELEYELPFEGEKLVVIGILNPDESFSIKVTHTWQATGIIPKNTNVEDAVVTILEDGKLKEQLVHGKEGNYLSLKGTRPLFGHKYSVEVSSSKYSKVSSAQVQIADNRPSYTYKQVSDFAYKYNKDIPKDQINVEIKDDPTKANFYAISFDLLGKLSNDGKSYYAGVVFYLDDDGKFSTNKECSFGQSIYKNSTGNNFQVFANQCFTTSSPIFHFAVDKAYGDIKDNKFIYFRIPQPTLNVYQFDKGYFEYLKLKNQPEGLFERAFTEPHTTFTNIKGGYGIIGAITQKTELLNMNCNICQ